MTLVTDASVIGGITGNAAFNAVPVSVEAAVSSPEPVATLAMRQRA